MYGIATSYSSVNTAFVPGAVVVTVSPPSRARHDAPDRAGGMRAAMSVLASAAASTKGGRMPGVRNRVAVVTGAANGLGREIALVLAREGARVALGDMEAAGLERTEHAITAAGGVAVAVAGDLTEED